MAPQIINAHAESRGHSDTKTLQQATTIYPNPSHISPSTFAHIDAAKKVASKGLKYAYNALKFGSIIDIVMR